MVANPAITSPVKLEIPCASIFPRNVAIPGSTTSDLTVILPSSSRFLALIISASSLPSGPLIVTPVDPIPTWKSSCGLSVPIPTEVTPTASLVP